MMTCGVLVALVGGLLDYCWLRVTGRRLFPPGPKEVYWGLRKKGYSHHEAWRMTGAYMKGQPLSGKPGKTATDRTSRQRADLRTRTPHT